MNISKKKGVIALLAIAKITLSLTLVSTLNLSSADETDPPTIFEAETFTIYPSDGIMTVRAHNLAQDEDDNQVFIDGKSLQVNEVRATGSEIDVFIPSTITSGDLTITSLGLTSEPFPLEFPTPEITSLEFPNGKNFEADFIINGAGFFENIHSNTVEILAQNNSEIFQLQVKEAKENELRVEFPNEPFEGYITVEKNGWYTEAVAVDLLLLPEISSLEYVGSSGLEYGQELRIHGANFMEDLSENIVVFEDGDGDPTEGLEVTPYFVDSTDLKEIRVLVPTGIENGDLYVKINDLESNKVPYELLAGPTISFNDRSAFLDSNNNVILNINSTDFSGVREQNLVYASGALATNEGMFGSEIIRANLGNVPNLIGTIWVETNGYKGNEVPYDITWLLAPNIGSMTTSSGFFPGKTITLRGINFTSETMLITESNVEHAITLGEPENTEMRAYIDGDAEIGDVVTIQLRNNIYNGNILVFTVGNPAREIQAYPEEDEEEEEIPEEEEPDEEEENEENEEETPVSSFSDVDSREWFAPAVASLVKRGSVQGRSDGLYHPSSNITRAEFLKMAMATEGIDPSGVNTETQFTDIDSHWAKKYILYAEIADFINSGDFFNPDSAITRAEATKILLKVFGVSEEDTTAEYFVDTGSHWSVRFAGKAFEEGIVEGEMDSAGNRYFYPDRNMNRAEAAKILFEMVE